MHENAAMLMRRPRPDITRLPNLLTQVIQSVQSDNLELAIHKLHLRVRACSAVEGDKRSDDGYLIEAGVGSGRKVGGRNEHDARLTCMIHAVVDDELNGVGALQVGNKGAQNVVGCDQGRCTAGRNGHERPFICEVRRRRVVIEGCAPIERDDRAGMNGLIRARDCGGRIIRAQTGDLADAVVLVVDDVQVAGGIESNVAGVSQQRIGRGTAIATVTIGERGADDGSDDAGSRVHTANHGAATYGISEIDVTGGIDRESFQVEPIPKPGFSSIELLAIFGTLRENANQHKVIQ